MQSHCSWEAFACSEPHFTWWWEVSGFWQDVRWISPHASEHAPEGRIPSWNKQRRWHWETTVSHMWGWVTWTFSHVLQIGVHTFLMAGIFKICLKLGVAYFLKWFCREYLHLLNKEPYLCFFRKVFELERHEVYIENSSIILKTNLRQLKELKYIHPAVQVIHLPNYSGVCVCVRLWRKFKWFFPSLFWRPMKNPKGTIFTRKLIL